MNRCYGIKVLWCYRAMVYWYYGTMVLWYIGTMVVWYHGSMAYWSCGVFAVVVILPTTKENRCSGKWVLDLAVGIMLLPRDMVVSRKEGRVGK